MADAKHTNSSPAASEASLHSSPDGHSALPTASDASDASATQAKHSVTQKPLFKSPPRLFKTPPLLEHSSSEDHSHRSYPEHHEHHKSYEWPCKSEKMKHTGGKEGGAHNHSTYHTHSEGCKLASPSFYDTPSELTQEEVEKSVEKQTVSAIAGAHPSSQHVMFTFETERVKHNGNSGRILKELSKSHRTLKEDDDDESDEEEEEDDDEDEDDVVDRTNRKLRNRRLSEESDESEKDDYSDVSNEDDDIDDSLSSETGSSRSMMTEDAGSFTPTLFTGQYSEGTTSSVSDLSTPKHLKHWANRSLSKSARNQLGSARGSRSPLRRNSEHSSSANRGKTHSEIIHISEEQHVDSKDAPTVEQAAQSVNMQRGQQMLQGRTHLEDNIYNSPGDENDSLLSDASSMSLSSTYSSLVPFAHNSHMSSPQFNSIARHGSSISLASSSYSPQTSPPFASNTHTETASPSLVLSPSRPEDSSALQDSLFIPQSFSVGAARDSSTPSSFSMVSPMSPSTPLSRSDYDTDPDFDTHSLSIASSSFDLRPIHLSPSTQRNFPTPTALTPAGSTPVSSTASPLSGYFSPVPPHRSPVPQPFPSSPAAFTFYSLAGAPPSSSLPSSLSHYQTQPFAPHHRHLQPHPSTPATSLSHSQTSDAASSRASSAATPPLIRNIHLNRRRTRAVAIAAQQTQLKANAVETASSPTKLN